MKRLGLFLFHDDDGVVDKYVQYLLDDIVENLSHLCIIVNGKLTFNSRKILYGYTDDIFIRSNLGFDAGGWKDAIMNHLGFEMLEEFDELVLFNESFFGPIYPFKEMFDVMDNKDLDFWGITVHGEAPDNRNLGGYGYRPRYLQTYFLAFRKDMLKSREFKEYWLKMEYFKNLTDLTFKHEAVFTRHFKDLGFKWEAYIDTSDLEGPRENAMNFFNYNMYELVVNRGLPVISRESFKAPRKLHLHYNLATDIPATVKYLKENTDYDVSLIYEYLLRIMEPAKIVDVLDLIKILPKYNVSDFKTDKKVLVIAHLFYIDLWEYAFDYLTNIPKYIDIVITTDSKEKKAFFEENILEKLNNKSQVILVKHRGRDVSALFVACKGIVKDYDYFCFIHDKKSLGKELKTLGISFRDLLWENSLASPSYIDSIINEFDEDPYLGLIVPPRVYQGTYFLAYKTKYWAVCYGVFKRLLKRMAIKTKHSSNQPPLSIGNVYWARYDALKPLFDLDLDWDDFPPEPLPGDGTIGHGIERIYAYVAASQNYYAEEVMTDAYGRSELNNFRYMFSTTLNMISKNSKNIVYDKSFDGFINTLPRGFINNRDSHIRKINVDLNKVKRENNRLKRLINQQSKRIEELSKANEQKDS